MVSVLTPLLVLGMGCNGSQSDSSETGADTGTGDGVLSAQEIERATTFSPLPTVPEDPSNAVYEDPAAAVLGQFLFFDPRLSGGGTFSCSTCHDPAKGYADAIPLSEAEGTTGRHAPTLLGVAHNDWFFWDGRADSLWAQALGPIEHPLEMNGSRLALAHLVYDDADLAQAYTAIFDELPDLDDDERFPAEGKPMSDDPGHVLAQAWAGMEETDRVAINRVYSNLGKAIAAYERLLVPGEAVFDVWVASLEEEPEGTTLFGEAERRGLQLFLGEGKCHFCHAGPNFSNRAFHNIGLGSRDWLDPFDSGRYSGISQLLQDPFNSAGDYSDDPDFGSLKIEHLVQDSELLGRFKTPSLRNLVDTAPFMHGGHFETLEEVVESYSLLEETPIIGHREDLMVKLDWSESEVANLLAFLESLTGSPLDEALNQAPDSPVYTP